jgi:hypothetical protein
MAKGGFLSEMLASKHATTDTNFLWRYLYYMYVGLPLLVVYFLAYQAICVMIVSSIQGLLGISTPRSLGEVSTLHWFALLAVNLGFVVSLYHFKILPYVFVPVKMITSV